jgi:6-phosphogluconolactonase
MTTQIYKPTLVEFETENYLYRHCTDLVEDKIINTVADNGLIRMLISGGNTPIPLYQDLSQSSIIDWQSVELYLTDERFVSWQDKDSNQKAIRDAFGQDVMAEFREVNFIDTSLSINQSILDYEEKLDSLDGIWFDLAVVGIGTDGHIASLFPGGDYLQHQKHSVISTQAPAEFPVRERVSLTLESILNSREILVVINGEQKATVINEFLEGRQSITNFPAKFLLTHPNVKVFYCVQ